jgi:hypothetical protein
MTVFASRRLSERDSGGVEAYEADEHVVERVGNDRGEQGAGEEVGASEGCTGDDMGRCSSALARHVRGREERRRRGERGQAADRGGEPAEQQSAPERLLVGGAAGQEHAPRQRSASADSCDDAE